MEGRTEFETELSFPCVLRRLRHFVDLDVQLRICVAYTRELLFNEVSIPPTMSAAISELSLKQAKETNNAPGTEMVVPRRQRQVELPQR